MAHYAELDSNNIVINVVVVDNSYMIDPETGQESEAMGIAHLNTIPGLEGRYWRQCSYNGRFRGCYPGIGYIWNPALETFDPPEPTEETP